MNTTIILDCKYCRKEFNDAKKHYRHEYYERNRERELLLMRRWSKNNTERRSFFVKQNNSRGYTRKRLWHEKKWFGGMKSLFDIKECQICKQKEDLIIHHIDGQNGRNGKLLNNDASNLIVICRSCHPTVHNRYWIKEVYAKNINT